MLEVCGKSIYAYEKVRDAIKDQDVSIYISMPKTKAKIVVLGDSGVGKTSIIYRHRFGDHYVALNATIGASFVTCDVETTIENEDMRLQIWDTAGQERFRCMVPMYMRNAAAALIVYDVTCRQSFLNVDKWANELQRSCGNVEPLIVLIANKIDLEDRRQVASGEGIHKALQLNARYYEVSAEDPAGFTCVLEDLTMDLLQDNRHVEALPEKPVDVIQPMTSHIEELKGLKTKCCGMF